MFGHNAGAKLSNLRANYYRFLIRAEANRNCLYAFELREDFRQFKSTYKLDKWLYWHFGTFIN